MLRLLLFLTAATYAHAFGTLLLRLPLALTLTSSARSTANVTGVRMSGWEYPLNSTELNSKTATSFTEMQQGADGFIYASGHFTGAQYFQTIHGPVRYETKPLDMSDVFVAKLTADGDFIWVRHIPGTAIERSAGLALDNSGHVFVAMNSIMEAPLSSPSFILPTTIYPSAVSPSSVISVADDISVSTNGPQYARGIIMQLNCDDGELIWYLNSTALSQAPGQFSFTALTWSSSNDVLYAAGFYGGGSVTRWGLPPLVLDQSRGIDLFIALIDPSSGVPLGAARYGPVDSLGATVVTSMKADVRGKVWIGGRSRGRQWFSDAFAYSGTSQWDLFVARLDMSAITPEFVSWGASALRTDEAISLAFDPTHSHVYVAGVVGDGFNWYGYSVKQKSVLSSAVILAKFRNPESSVPVLEWITAAGISGDPNVHAPSLPLRNALTIDSDGNIYLPFVSLAGGNLTAYSFANSNASSIRHGGPVLTPGTLTGQNDVYLSLAKYNPSGTLWWISTDGPIGSEVRSDPRSISATGSINMQFPNFGGIVYGSDGAIRVGAHFRGSVSGCMGTVGTAQSVLSVPTALATTSTLCPAMLLFLKYQDVDPCLSDNGGCAGTCVYGAFGTPSSYECA